MSGPHFHQLCQGNLPSLTNVMQLVHSEHPAEVQVLVSHIRAVVMASMEMNNPDGLRGPLTRLLNVMARDEYAFCTDQVKFTYLIWARLVVAKSMRAIDLRRQAPPTRLAPQAPDHTFADIQAHFPLQPPAPNSPIMARRSSRRGRQQLVMVKEEPLDPDEEPVAPQPEVTPAAAGAQQIIQKKKCDHCHMEIPDDPAQKLMHVWKKHKDQVYRLIRPEIVCTLEFCDYVGSSVHSRKIHEGRTHGQRTLKQKNVISELIAGNCIYCNMEISSLVQLKLHMLQCKERDERPMLACSSCPRTFHFIYDFVTHLKTNGGIAHGLPVLHKDT